MQPRECFQNPTLFGKVEHLDISTTKPTPYTSSAVIQNSFSFHARKAIKSRYGTLKNYCEQTEQSYQRVSQVLRGAVKANLSDFGAAAANLGILIDFENASKGLCGSTSLAAHTEYKNSVGAFYTPDDISSYIVNRIPIDSSSRVLEPSFGDGSFLKALIPHRSKIDSCVGCEIDSEACSAAKANGLLSDSDAIFFGSFFDYPISNRFTTAIGNPPFVRLRNLEAKEAEKISDCISNLTGLTIKEESSEWLPFLIKAACHLEKGGCLAFVLPFDFTYVKYARDFWKWLGENFESVEVARSKERLFDDILQDVVLLYAFRKGGKTKHVRYCCYETKRQLINEQPVVDKLVDIDRVAEGHRAFQEAMVDSHILEAINSNADIIKASIEADFHIGYVCGNKTYFHPSRTRIEQYSLPNSSLKNVAMNSRQFGKCGVFASSCAQIEKLWRPGAELTSEEQLYVEYGEKTGVSKGYKCSKRSPWWVVPGVETPEVIMSVFGEVPKTFINDCQLAVSNSLLGVYLKEGINPNLFCMTWYTPLTLLSMELQIHALGGGVMVAVPREASNIRKVAVEKINNVALDKINKCLVEGNVQAAYYCGASLANNLLGKSTTDSIIESYERIKTWRIR